MIRFRLFGPGIACSHDRNETASIRWVAGTVINQGRFYPRFAEVVLLSAPLEVLIELVASRDTNPFGKTEQERDRIVADTSEVEPLLRTSASLEIDTRRPLADVVDQLAALASPPRSPR